MQLFGGKTKGERRKSGSKGNRHGIWTRKLDVYRVAIEYFGWVYRFCEALAGQRNAKDPLLRAAQAIRLNIAEGNGKGTDGDRRRYFESARGSAAVYEKTEEYRTNQSDPDTDPERKP